MLLEVELGGIWQSRWWTVLDPWLPFIQVTILILICGSLVTTLARELRKVFRDDGVEVPVTAANPATVANGNLRRLATFGNIRHLQPTAEHIFNPTIFNTFRTRQPFTRVLTREHRIQHLFNTEIEMRWMDSNRRLQQCEEICEQLSSRTTHRVKEEQLSAKLDLLIIISLENIRMAVKSKHNLEKSEREWQHLQKMYEDMETRLHFVEYMEHMHQRRSFLAAREKGQGDATGGISSMYFGGNTRTEMREMLWWWESGRVKLLRAELDYIIKTESEGILIKFEQVNHDWEKNKRQFQHPWKMCDYKKCEDKEKQLLREEKMKGMHLRRGSFLADSQKAHGDEMGGTSSMSFCEDEKARGDDGVMDHLGLQVPSILVSVAEPEWSSSRLDLTIENKVEKKGMEFELTRLKLEHEKNKQQQQHEGKMEGCVSRQPSER